VTIPNTMLSFITHRDHKLMHRVNRWSAPRWIRVWMLCATRGGDGWLWYALGLILVIYGGEQRFAAIGAGASAAVAGIFLFRALKRTSRRKRPCEIEPHCWASILPPDKYSFPSGHSITAFAVAISLGLFYPFLWSLLLVVAFLIAVSRIILGMHFLSDVLAGSAIGVTLGVISYHIFAFI